jgi:hypothetical protein
MREVVYIVCGVAKTDLLTAEGKTLAKLFSITTQQLCAQSTMTHRKVIAKFTLKPLACYAYNFLDSAVALWETNSNYPASHDFTDNQSKLQ